MLFVSTVCVSFLCLSFLSLSLHTLSLYSYTHHFDIITRVQVYSGHLYVCATVALVEFLLFRELVRVRYSTFYKSTIENRIPLFRTTQWMWFCLAIFYTYGDFVTDIVQNNAKLHYLLRTTRILQYWGSISFVLYSATFVLTIATLQRKHIKFQINQLCWTVLVLCLTVGQLKYVMHNIFNGLIWYVLPCCLVFTNDIMAYVTGMTFGRKFIRRPFIKFSPNKTWEGFIGGGICTMIAAWYLSRVLAQYKWMTCPTNEFHLKPLDSLKCDNHHIFQEAQSIIPDQVFEILPTHLVKMIPGIVEYCSVKSSSTTTSSNTMGSAAALLLAPCISGEPTHTFHHVELVLHNVYPVQIHALWLGFFASVVAPFGGFLASAIKRAYGIKDFDSFIPGHGGVTDRLDCQFLMALCTWVHYNTFVKLATVSVPKLMYMYQMLSEDEKKAFVAGIRRNGP